MVTSNVTVAVVGRAQILADCRRYVLDLFTIRFNGTGEWKRESCAVPRFEDAL